MFMLSRYCKSLPTLTLLSTTKIYLRNLSLLEYQTKKILRDYGVPVQDFVLVDKSTDFSSIDFDQDFYAKQYVVKAQILAGGRGKGMFLNSHLRGVKLIDNQSDLKRVVNEMVGNMLITNQTPKTGMKVNQVMIAKSVDIIREGYLSIIMDPAKDGPVLIASAEGGVNIEDLSKSNPEKIIFIPIDIELGITDTIAKDVSRFLCFSEKLIDPLAREIKHIWKIFLDIDALQLEINPFCETSDEKIMAVDAKICFDDNAKFRQKDIFSLEQDVAYDYREALAAKYKLNYVLMDGNIACLVNGAGLAMATMDLITFHGGKPANFLDVSGNVSDKMISVCFEIFNHDQNTRVIMVNVFGGIVDCTKIANGLVRAYTLNRWKIPLVVRLEGLNARFAKRILRDSEILVYFASDFDDAALKAVMYANVLPTDNIE